MAISLPSHETSTLQGEVSAEALPIAAHMLFGTDGGGIESDGAGGLKVSGGTGGGASQGIAGDAAITTGGTAQLLFGGATPVNGFEIVNPDPAEDLWFSDSTTAAINGQGSMNAAPGGAGYVTPTGYKPVGAVSVIAATTGHKISARRW